VSADRRDAGGDAPRPPDDSVDELGAIVVDADDDSDDPDPAVVVNLPPVTCADWVAYDDVTVAEDNPGYDDEAYVVVVAFREDLRASHPDWDADAPLSLPLDCKTYAFPPGRLRRVGDHHGPDRPGERVQEGADAVDSDDTEADTVSAPADRLTESQEALRARLEESADVAVASDPDDAEAAVLVVEKLGGTHRIAADGSVDGGPLADRLADVAAEYLGGEGE